MCSNPSTRIFNLATIACNLKLNRESNTNNENRQYPIPTVKYQMFGRRHQQKKIQKLPYRNQKKKMTPGVGHTSPNYLFGEANHCNYLWNALAEDFIEAQKEIEESAN